jgi:hypothetical protein
LQDRDSQPDQRGSDHNYGKRDEQHAARVTDTSKDSGPVGEVTGPGSGRRQEA